MKNSSISPRAYLIPVTNIIEDMKKKTQVLDIRLPTSLEAFQLQLHKAREDETSTQPDSSEQNNPTVEPQMTYATSISIYSTNASTQNALQEKPREKPNQPTPGSLMRETDQPTLWRPAEKADQSIPDNPAGESEQDILNSSFKTPDQPLRGEPSVIMPARPTIETTAAVPRPLGQCSHGQGSHERNTIRLPRAPKYLMWVCVSVSMLLMESSA